MRNRAQILFPTLAIVFLLGLLTFILAPFFVSFLLSAMMSVVLYPFYKRMLHWKFPKWASAVIVISAFCLMLLIPLGLALTKGAQSTLKVLNVKITEFSGRKGGQAPEKILEKLNHDAEAISDRWGLDLPDPQEMAVEFGQTAGTWVLVLLKNFLAQIPELLLGFFIISMMVYFGLVEADRVRIWICKMSFLSPNHHRRVISILYLNSKSVFYSNVVTGIIQATVVGIGTAIAGTADPFVVGFITFVTSFIPIIGAAPVALLLAGVELTQNEYTDFFILLGTGIFAGGIDNIIRPVILAGSSETHPLIGFLAIIGGIYVFGLPGLFIGPLIVSVAVSLIPLYVEEVKDRWNSPR